MSASSRSLANCLRGVSQGDTDLYVMINASTEAQTFGIHEATTGHWRRAIDTARPSPHDIVDLGGEQPVGANCYEIQPRSVAIFVGHSTPEAVGTLHRLGLKIIMLTATISAQRRPWPTN